MGRGVGEADGPPRYCHFASDDEIREHLRALEAAGASRVECFDDDGDGRRLNRYALVGKGPAAA